LLNTRGLNFSTILLAVALTSCGSEDVVTSSMVTLQSASEGIQISVLSNRADLISGGDALIEIITPDAGEPSVLSMVSRSTSH